MSTSFMTDPLWYKDAVIYELHVRSFFDSNNDGYGDFEGLRQKLPYLESLGVNTLWLLPFLESPLKDDGYDTADYLKVLPVHGTLDDFKAFLDDAHTRGMRVITELVLNHTSDQHPWFQEARDPRSPRHNWYVWSDTPEKYRGARIIFTDTEVSNWSWDRKAGRYYWHRFFSHQPDLNYDNPEVRKVMKEVMFFWLDMGVDGLRLDAVPYLFEREGTSCENLPETIEYIRELRHAIEERYGAGKVLLAEANQWPEDTLPYFAGGLGVQMAFNFPIMPRMYMALRREHRGPLVGMLEMTQDIPPECQWAIFLRNHDELTLEMVTDEERDYMYHEYAADSRFRINVGIRRRLTPLVEGERRRIELLNALLLSLPGSPVLYYGDEIGMGDDPFLGDRNGVRTPMQWSPDKNGGFSRAPHHRLFMPAIDHGPYSYEFINVEDSESDPHSLLAFTKRLLSLRKQYGSVFGRGTFQVLPVENQSVFAFVREYEGKKVLIVANLSRFGQHAQIPVSDLTTGTVPVELFSRSPFPVIGDTPYAFTLGPFGFFWFALEPVTEEGAGREPQIASLMAAAGELPIFQVQEGLQNLLIRTMVRDRGLERLEALLPDFLMHQRWFGFKDRKIQSVKIEDAVRLAASPSSVYLSGITVTMDGGSARYVLPFMLAHGEDALRILEERSAAALAWVDGPTGRGLLHDATASPAFWLTLYRWWRQGGKARSLRGLYSTTAGDALVDVPGTSVRVLSAEQSNSSAIIDGKIFAKLYRKVERGVNPETELLEYITTSNFRFVPKLQGTLTFHRADIQFNLGILQDALPVESDGWDYARAQVALFFDRVAEMPIPEDKPPQTYSDVPPSWLEQLSPELISLARLLGVRTGELHVALSKAEAPALKPQAGTPEETVQLAMHIRQEANDTRQMIEANPELREKLSGEFWEQALSRLDDIARLGHGRQRIRIHGDYHLGQVTRAEGEFYILDFEGEPKRSLEERRAHGYALRDVAGMLRSFDYAIRSVYFERDPDDERLACWGEWLVQWCQAVFLNGYFSTTTGCEFVAPTEAQSEYLWLHLFEKALYEVRYELSHRPGWVWLPIAGLKQLLGPGCIA